MKENHAFAIQVLKNFISELPSHKYLRAVEAACGAGQLSRDFLCKRYTHVRMFDQCPNAKEDAEDNTINFDNVEFIELCRMQDYKFDDIGEITAVYIRWCLGYLEREEQISFLRRAADALVNTPGKYTRSNGPASYLFIMDNVDDEADRKEPLKYNGQIIQTVQYYLELFQEAGLEIHRQKQKSLNPNYWRVGVWALYKKEMEDCALKQNGKE